MRKTFSECLLSVCSQNYFHCLLSKLFSLSFQSFFSRSLQTLLRFFSMKFNISHLSSHPHNSNCSLDIPHSITQSIKFSLNISTVLVVNTKNSSIFGKRYLWKENAIETTTANNKVHLHVTHGTTGIGVRLPESSSHIS